MLDKINVLKHIDEVLYRLSDENGTILYPTVEFEKNKFNNLVSLGINDNVIYDIKNNKWYEFHKKNFNENNKLYTVEYLIDITLLKEKEKRYQIDSLTCVLTRAAILNKIQSELSICFKNDIPFSIIIGDIDLFKEVNDTYGHIAGDKVLKEIGNIFLQHTTKENEFVGRYGGEEFLFFIENCTLEESVNKIKEINKLLKNLSVNSKDKIISDITMSFGIYHLDTNKGSLNDNIMDTMSELIYNADMALYKSKKLGRNQTHIYSCDGNIYKANII